MKALQYFNSLPLTIDQVHFNAHNFNILRLDKIHAEASGNKFFKLKYNLLEAEKEGYNQVLTFGGAFSNHIHSTALCCQQLNIECIGVIRGEEVDNPTLADAKEAGMKLHFVSRKAYKERYDPAYILKLEDKFGKFFHIPEGGTNKLAIEGTAEIHKHIPKSFTTILTASGTLGTAAGLINGSSVNQCISIVPVLKGSWVEDELVSLGLSNSRYTILYDYHFGGYAKWNSELIDFINAFKRQTGIQLDPVYTGKLFYAAYNQFQQEKLDPYKSILIHSGGLQGIRGFNQRFGNLIET